MSGEVVIGQIQKGRVALVASYTGAPVPIPTVTVGGAPAAIAGPAYIQAALLFDASGNPLVWRDDGLEKVMPTMGKILDPSGTPVGNLANPLVVSDAAGAVSAAIVTADFYRMTSVAAPGTQDYIAVDLDNSGGAPGTPGTGPYKHDHTQPGLKVAWLSMSIEKQKITDSWDCRFGVITRVDGTDSDITWLQDGFLRSRTTLRNEERHVVDRSAALLDLTVTSNVLDDVAGSLILLGDTTVKDTDTLEDVAGNSVNPAVGDIILRVDHTSGSGQLLVHYQFGYYA